MPVIHVYNRTSDSIIVGGRTILKGGRTSFYVSNIAVELYEAGKSESVLDKDLIDDFNLYREIKALESKGVISIVIEGQIDATGGISVYQDGSLLGIAKELDFDSSSMNVSLSGDKLVISSLGAVITDRVVFMSSYELVPGSGFFVNSLIPYQSVPLVVKYGTVTDIGAGTWLSSSFVDYDGSTLQNKYVNSFAVIDPATGQLEEATGIAFTNDVNTNNPYVVVWGGRGLLSGVNSGFAVLGSDVEYARFGITIGGLSDIEGSSFYGMKIDVANEFWGLSFGSVDGLWFERLQPTSYNVFGEVPWAVTENLAFVATMFLINKDIALPGDPGGITKLHVDSGLVYSVALASGVQVLDLKIATLDGVTKSIGWISNPTTNKLRRARGILLEAEDGSAVFMLRVSAAGQLVIENVTAYA